MNYKEMGFRCGIEIHQQLEGRKLFCNCQALNLRNTKPDMIFSRRLRAVAGETGKIDLAAEHETSISRKFIYEGDSRDCCLVEMDEAPPDPINSEAVDAALQVALMLKAKIVDEIQVMRKIVVDGSNTTGFQRTALVGYDGVVETSKGKVRIPTILIEEEACQAIERTKEQTRYRLDRLGIPLIEIATEPDIKDPEHAKETAEKIGMMLRSTGKVKRGIGTIRQDVNISIKGKNRTEIKGFQDLRSMPAVIEKEIERQAALDEKEDSHVRKVEPDNSTSYLRPMPGSARMYPETDVIPFRVDISEIETAELIEDKAKRYEKIGLDKDLARSVAKSEKAPIFEKIANKFTNVKPAFIAETLTSTIKEIKRRYKTEFDISEKELEKIFTALDKDEISKNTVMDILIDHAGGNFKNIEDYRQEQIGNLEEEIKKIVEEKPGLNPKAYMGLIMKRFSGRIDGKKAMQALNKILN